MKKQENKNNVSTSEKKKPFYKKWWFWLIIAVVVIGSIAGAGSNDDEQKNDSLSSGENAADANTDADAENNAESDSVKESGRYTLPSGYEISFNNFVRNDTTGKWRIATTSDSFVPADYALEYYETMFAEYGEVHFIWNATLKTMTCITANNGIISAVTHEYVKGEEHDAKTLGSGMVLDERLIVIETGEELEE